MDQDATWYGGRPRPTRHCVRCGPATPRKKGTLTPPNVWPMSIVAKWLDEDAAWYGSRPRPRPHCTRRGPSSRERGTAALFFRPMSIVATVAHLGYCWALVVIALMEFFTICRRDNAKVCCLSLWLTDRILSSQCMVFSVLEKNKYIDVRETNGISCSEIKTQFKFVNESNCHISEWQTNDFF